MPSLSFSQWMSTPNFCFTSFTSHFICSLSLSQKGVPSLWQSPDNAVFGNDKEHQHTLGESMYQPIPYKISSPLLLGLSKYLLLIGTESNIKAGVLCGTFLSLASLLYIIFMAFTMSCTFVLML